MTAKQGKLDPALKAAWLADLESGEHQQHQFEWGNPDGPNRCCLNVLGEITISKIKPELIETVRRGWAQALCDTGIINDNMYEALISANDDGPPDNYARVCRYIRENL